MDVHAQLAEIRRVVEKAKSMPMSASVLVNKAELIGLVDKLDEALTDAFAEAGRVTGDRDGVLAKAREEAEEILAEARVERDRLVTDVEVHSHAKESADTLLAEAKKEAEELRREADEYVDLKFATFEVTLTKTLDALTRGREQLHGRSDLDALRHGDVDDITLPGDAG